MSLFKRKPRPKMGDLRIIVERESTGLWVAKVREYSNSHGYSMWVDAADSKELDTRKTITNFFVGGTPEEACERARHLVHTIETRRKWHDERFEC